MAYEVAYNKNFGKWFLNDLIRAIEKYQMIQSGEKVAVALSGGKDSTTLLFLFHLLQQYSHLEFEFSAIHVKVADYNSEVLSTYCETLGIQYIEQTLDTGLDESDNVS